MKLPKTDELCELAGSPVGKIIGEFEIIQSRISSHSRWSINHEIIVKYKGKYYSTFYSEGATEYQDESPWDHQNEIEFKEVIPLQKTVTVYEAL